MKQYKGIVTIKCKHKKCILKNVKKDVVPSCANCPAGKVMIINLDGKVLAKINKKLTVKKEK